jgi:hypothetical protein
MEIVVALWSLRGLGGTETQTITVADHLQRLGHDVWLHSAEHGRGTELAEGLGLRVTRDEAELPAAPGVVVAHDAAASCEMAARYAAVPQVFVAHSDIFDLQLPLQIPHLVSVVVATYDRVEQRVRALGLEHEVVRLRQPVDVERFKPTRPPRARARVALALSNYLHGERREVLERACSRAGLELRHAGRHSDAGLVPAERELNEADVVFGKARVIHEAMACGRAAYVFDHNGAEGWVTAESYPVLVADNFGGQSRPVPIDEDRLVADLESYDAGMGLVNRDLAVAHHGATKHAAALVEVLERVTPRTAPLDAPLRELGRLVRLYHRADTQSFSLNAEAQSLGGQVNRLEEELARARTEVELAVADAQRAWQALRDLKATRRWRVAQSTLRPADRLRSALGRR